MRNPLLNSLTNLGTFTARPAAFAIPFAYGGLWLAFEPETFDWHGLATMATWLMTLFIQRAEHRDTQAIHAKLDALVQADRNVSDSLARIDEQEPEAIEAARERRNS